MRYTPLLLLILSLAGGCSDPGKDDPDGSSHCTPLTERGVCNLFEQCGCEGDEWCRLAFDDSDCTFFEDCTSAPRGPSGAEAECYGSFLDDHECRPGTACFWVEHMYSDRCHEWCRTDEDCSVEGRTCTVPLTYANFYCTTPVEAPFRACSMDF